MAFVVIAAEMTASLTLDKASGLVTEERCSGIWGPPVVPVSQSHLVHLGTPFVAAQRNSVSAPRLRPKARHIILGFPGASRRHGVEGT